MRLWIIAVLFVVLLCAACVPVPEEENVTISVSDTVVEVDNARDADRVIEEVKAPKAEEKKETPKEAKKEAKAEKKEEPKPEAKKG